MWCYVLPVYGNNEKLIEYLYHSKQHIIIMTVCCMYMDIIIHVLSACLCVCICVCVRACVRACVHACVMR